MLKLKDCTFWLLTGSQFLYGEETLGQVHKNSEIMARSLNHSGNLPCAIIFKGVMKTADEITAVIKQANADDSCAGIITFCHTFSPSKMWIHGLSLLQKPLVHLHTQYNRNIPHDIDMDYMNLHQSAHGDREHGFIHTRMKPAMGRKIIAGYWQDADVHAELSGFMRAAAGFKASRELKVMRFGDNMREVAVTEGDKVEAQIKLGWQINTHGAGALAERLGTVTEQQLDELIEIYDERYKFDTRISEMDNVRYQARLELAMKSMLDEHGCGAFTNTFEDLYGMEQLPGLASQRLMEMGYGYGGEGDWKTSALVHIMKVMAQELDSSGTSFMEDYTYDLTKGEELVLGAHMLEVCPSIAADVPKIEVHPLGIGGKNPPARLVFEGMEGPAINASLVDMGGRMRLIVQEVECVKPVHSFPLLPVARVMWRLLPDFKTAVTAWLMAGGAHHTVLSYGATADMMRDFARMADIEFVYLNAGTDLAVLERGLIQDDIIWRLKLNK